MHADRRKKNIANRSRDADGLDFVEHCENDGFRFIALGVRALSIL